VAAAETSASRGTILVLGSNSRATTELCAELEATRCRVIRGDVDAPIERAMRDPDVVAVVAARRAVIARVAAEVVAAMPGTHVIGFLDGDDSGDDAIVEVATAGRIYDLCAMRTRPLSAMVPLILEQDAVVARLQKCTSEMEQLVSAGARTRAGLHQVSQLIRSHGCGVLMGLQSLRWAAAALSPADQALIDSIRVSVESVLVIADGLGSDRS
jgi:hypothetical protein